MMQQGEIQVFSRPKSVPGRQKSSVMVGAACFILLPVFWLLSLIGLNYTWLAFPVAETAAGALGYIMYRRQLKVWK